jgi:hypothetical protein
VTTAAKASGSSQKKRCPSPGSNDQLRADDPAGEQPRVPRVDNLVGGTVQDQRAGPDASLPELAVVTRAGCRLSTPSAQVMTSCRSLAAQNAVHEVRPMHDGCRRQSALDQAPRLRVPLQPPGRPEQSHERRRHRVRERPSRRRAGENQPVDALRMLDREILGDHSAQTGARYVSGVDADVVEYAHDIAAHVSDADAA